MNDSGTIAALFKQRLERVSALIVAVVFVVAGSLYMFVSYTGVVNDAGIVRGGSQRVVKQVLAGADEAKTVKAVEGKLASIGTRMHLGGFPGGTGRLRGVLERYRETGHRAV